MKEYVIRYRLTLMLTAFLLLSGVGNAVSGSASFELLEAPGRSHWADFSLSRNGEDMGCLLGGAVYWWTAEGGFRFLDQGITSQGGVGMAADGGSLVAAKAGGSGALPAIWYKNGSSLDLGVLQGDCRMDHKFDGGFDISADGTVAVGQTASCTGEVAFVWTARDGIHGLPAGGDGDSRGIAVSADGNTVAGFSEHPAKDYRRPALWRNGNGPILFLGPDSSGEAMNVSPNGSFVVGQAHMGGLSPQAFFWKNGSEPVSLGNLSGRATDTSLAKAVSDDGKVVGWSGDALWGDQEAFIWTQSAGMRSLVAYLAARDVKVPHDMVLTAAMDISGDGATVVGTCRDKDWNLGYWLVKLGDFSDSPPAVPAESWEPKPLDNSLADTLHTFPAEILNPFPFGKHRYMPAP